MDSEGPSQEFWRARSRASHCGSKHATCTISSKTWPSARCYLTCILTLMKLDAILNMPASDPRAHSTNCEWTLPSHLSASLASMCIHSFQKSPSCRPSDSTSLAAPRERTTKPNREPLSGLINDEADSSRDVPEAPLQPSGVTGDAQIRGRASALLRTCSSPLPGPPTPSSSFLHPPWRSCYWCIPIITGAWSLSLHKERMKFPSDCSLPSAAGHRKNSRNSLCGQAPHNR